MKLNSIGKISATILLSAFATAAPAKEFFVYFGTYTNALSRGIYVARLDADTGKISAPELAAEVPNPCFLNLSPDRRFLYSANSTKFDGNNGSVSAFAVDKKSGGLKLLNEKSTGGNGPCHVSVDVSGKVLLAANYGSGSVKSFRLENNGSIGVEGSLLQHTGNGVNTNRQSSPHAHFISTAPGNHFALTCDLGLDRVLVYRLNSTKAALEVQYGYSMADVPPGAGARHLVFSRDEKSVYVLNEMGCSISRFSWEAESGSLEAHETITALPAGVAVQKNFTAAEILVHPSGKFIYATLRGHDSVSVFSLDDKSGKLSLVQNLSCGGKVPRGLGIDPTGRWLFTGNQKSDNAVEFFIEAKTGKLTATGTELRIGSPVDVKFVAAE